MPRSDAAAAPANLLLEPGEADLPKPSAVNCQLPFKVRYVLGDNHYHTPELYEQCEHHNRLLVASGRGPYPRTDPGAPVRKIIHRLRHQAIEPFNGLFKNVSEWRGQVPVKGLKRTQLIVLGAVLLYQLVLLHQFEHDMPLGKGIKPLLRAA